MRLDLPKYLGTKRAGAVYNPRLLTDCSCSVKARVVLLKLIELSVVTSKENIFSKNI